MARGWSPSISISGKVAGPAGETTVNAEVLFTFLAESTPKLRSTKPTFPPGPRGRHRGPGAITELRLARVTSGPCPAPAGSGSSRTAR